MTEPELAAGALPPGGGANVHAASAAPESMDALAFATDAASEEALREGLSHLGNAQVWSGGLRAAVEVLRQGHAASLVFVDLDAETYPAGALFELSAVCEEGTVVVAFGADTTAQCCREALLAGVREYLVKPLEPSTVRAAAARAGGATPGIPRGRLLGFTGTGGTGATTLAALTALAVAARGHYVSVLDLNRTCPAVSLCLDVEPASGLVDLLGTAARASLHPEVVERVGTRRSERITLYGYPQSASTPPLAPAWAVCELLVELQQRSHLVIVDGVDNAELCHALLALVDTRVLVVEPTATGAPAAVRTVARLGPILGTGWPHVVVQNHTRNFTLTAGARALARAGLSARPHVAVPFEPALPGFALAGMPDGRLPGRLRAPIDQLTRRMLAPDAPKARAAVETPERPEAAPKARARRTGPRTSRARRSPLRTVLRGLLGSRSGRSQSAGRT